MKQATLIAALALATALPVSADEIQLTNGRKISGVVVKDPRPGKVVVEVGAGTITFDAKDVSSVNPGRTAIHEYQDRFAEVQNSKKASDFVDLAAWAKEKGLTRYVVPLSLRAIELDPDNAAARANLRHEKIGGKWLTFEQAQESRGFVFRDDRWMTKAEIELIEKRRIEARERAHAVAEAREQRREEEKSRRQAAIDDYNRMVDSAMGQLDGYFYSPSFAWTTPYFRPYPWASYARSRAVFQHGWRYDGGVVIGVGGWR